MLVKVKGNLSSLAERCPGKGIPLTRSFLAVVDFISVLHQLFTLVILNLSSFAERCSGERNILVRLSRPFSLLLLPKYIRFSLSQNTSGFHSCYSRVVVLGGPVSTRRDSSHSLIPAPLMGFLHQKYTSFSVSLFN